MIDQNHQVYISREIVYHYSQLRQLQPAEQTILELLRNECSLSNMKMLDIGVGGGRTTEYFSSVVQEYIGIDYSEEMIAACQKRFPSQSNVFQVADARDMSRFPDSSFDFILFSFNGLDVISHLDRLQVLQEVRRVGKSGGYFCFSSHNLQALEREMNWTNHISLNPIKTYVNLIMFTLLRLLNRSVSLKQIKDSNYEIIQDEPHNFRLKHYYIRPQEQIEQLKSNFDNIRIYSWESGLELSTQEDLSANTDIWLYYLCEIK